MSYEMVVSLGLAAMRTGTGFCYRNADSGTAQAVAFPDTAKQVKQAQTKKSSTWSERKRRGACCRRGEEDGRGERWKRARAAGVETAGAAAAPGDGDAGGAPDLFEGLPDDIVVCILCRLSSSSSAPADLANVVLTCKRMRNLLLNPLVLAKASGKALTVRASKWSDAAQRFLKMCADAGNLEACYILGMIRFYCLHNRGAGASLMARAAIGSHAAALYSLAVIQFNGSGGSKNDKDLRAGVALCARAAFLGNIDALRELGHCLQDGYGVRQNVAKGRRFLVQANARELASVVPASQPRPSAPPPPWITAWTQHAHRHRPRPVPGCPLVSDFGCNVRVPEPHPANRFLAEWFGCCPVSYEAVTGLRLCSHAGCGRPETRRHEFRRCSVCGVVNYCSRACQAVDWKLRHKYQCAPMERGLHPAAVPPFGGEGFPDAPFDGPPVVD